MRDVSASRGRGASRLDPIAAAWGGLVGAVGLMAGSGRELATRLAIVVLVFAIGGFLAGVRAISRRLAHAAAACVLAYGLYVVFVIVASLADLVGGRDRPSLIPGGWSASGAALVAAVVAAMAGGAIANSWLRPAGQGKRYS